MATTKTVTVQIDPADLKRLRNLNYCMCFAKKVSNDFNVVWHSCTDYLATSRFIWISAYRMFATSKFTAGDRVSIQTELVDVGLGEMLTLDPVGDLKGPAVSSGDPGGITLSNAFGLIHPGLAIGPDGQTTPVYVAKDPIAKGTDTTLYPTEIVRVWFAQNAVTGTISGEAPSYFVDIDMTATDTATRLYKDAMWTTTAT